MNSYIKSGLCLWMGVSACQAPENLERSHWEEPDGTDSRDEADASPEPQPKAESRAGEPLVTQEDPEEVSLPVPVSGVFLTGSIEETGADYLWVGLRGFFMEQRTRDLPADFSTSWVVTPSREVAYPARIEISKDPAFDAFLILNGGAGEELKAALSAFEIQVRIQDGRVSKQADVHVFNAAEIIQP